MYKIQHPTTAIEHMNLHTLKLNANLDLIVAMTTVKDFITAGGSDATPPSVV
jgi:hypothetical protein